MADTYTETILFDLPLPNLLVQFKNSVNSILIPRLNTIIADIQKKQSNSSVLTLLCLLFFFLIIKSIIDNLFKSNAGQNSIASKPVTQSQIDEQIRALANQIRNVKNSLKKIIQEAAKQPLQQTTTQSGNDINTQDVSRLMDYYKQSAEDFNNLAEIILNSQQSIFKQLKNAKKLRAPAEKTSSHGSRQSKESKQQASTENIWQEKPINEFRPAKQQNDAVDTQVQQQIAEPEIKSEIKPPVIPKQIRPPAPGIKKRVPPPPIPRS